MPLRALATTAPNHAIGLENAKAFWNASITVNLARVEFELGGKVYGIDLLHPAIRRAALAQPICLPSRAWPWPICTFRSGRDRGGQVEGRLPSPWHSRAGWNPLQPRGALLSVDAQSPAGFLRALLLGQPEPVRQALSGLELDGKLGLRDVLWNSMPAAGRTWSSGCRRVAPVRGQARSHGALQLAAGPSQGQRRRPASNQPATRHFPSRFHPLGADAETLAIRLF